MSGFRYRAFISYSHQDEKWAAWLQRRLETYRPPRDLASIGPFKPIFRDREELAAAVDLSESIRAALEASENLIVVCSPHAAASRWVNQEVIAYIAMGRGDRIYCLFVDGKPNDAEAECLPESLRSTEGREPLGADVRAAADGRNGAVLKIVAALANVGLDEIRRRDQQRRSRRASLIAVVSLLGMAFSIVLASTAYVARVAAELERAKAEAVTTFLTDMIQSVDPSQARGRDVSVRDALDAAAARLDAGAMRDQIEVQIAIRNVIGTTYGNLGLYEAAEAQLGQAIDLGGSAGIDPLTRAQSYTRLTDTLYKAGRLTDAETAAREALRLSRAALGAGDPLVGSSLDDLGAVLVARGRYEEAEPLLREALAIKRASLPAGDPRISTGINNLAYLTWRQGDAQTAETLFREALEIDRQQLGADDPEVATKLINVAVAVRDQGRPEDAEALVREALGIQQRVLGDRHPALANTLDVLAGTHEDRGEYAQAESELRSALEIATAAQVGLDTARLQSNLGWVLWKKGAYADAEPLLVDGLANTTASYGPTHRNTRLVTSYLAHELNSIGDALGAESRAREALAMFREAPTDSSVVSALLALGEALLAQQRSDEAIVPLREALARFDQPVPIRSRWMQGAVESRLGEALALQGAAEEAESRLVSGAERLQQQRAAPPACAREALLRVAEFYQRVGRAEDAARWRRRLHERSADTGVFASRPETPLN